jgi:hypothetical protein
MHPLRRKADEGVGSEPPEALRRESDKPDDFGILDAVAEDLLLAIENKDKGRLKAALESLCDHIATKDEQQDQELGAFRDH